MNHALVHGFSVAYVWATGFLVAAAGIAFVAVAAGRPQVAAASAAGPLEERDGELTQVLPFDLVDAVLEETFTVQLRLRDLPSRVGVYFMLSMCLFPEIGYRLVWQKLTAALYHDRQNDGRPDTSCTVTDLAIAILAPEPDLPVTSHDDRHTPSDDRRRQRVLDPLEEELDRHWHPRDLARHLGDIALGTMRRQLDRWAGQGLVHEAGPVTYTSQDDPLSPARIR